MMRKKKTIAGVFAVGLLACAVGELSYDIFRPRDAHAQSLFSYAIGELFATTPSNKPLEYFVAAGVQPDGVGPNESHGWPFIQDAVRWNGSNIILRDPIGGQVVPSGWLGYFGAINTVSTIYGVNVGTNSPVNTIMSRADVHLSSGAVANGDVTAFSDVFLDPGAVVTGTITENATFAAKRPALRIALPDNMGQNVMVNQGQTVSLPPGVYFNALINGTLNLSKGKYYFNEFVTGSTGVVNIASSGVTAVHARYKILHAGQLGNIESAAPRFVAFLQGGDTVHVDGRWGGTLIAPNAVIDVKSTAQPHIGEFIGYQVLVATGTQVKHEPVAINQVFPGFDGYNDLHDSNDTCSPRATGTHSSAPPTKGELIGNLDQFIQKLTALQAELN